VGSREAISWLVCGAIAVVLVGLVLFGGSSSDRGGSGPGSDDQTRTEIGRLLTSTLTTNDPVQCTQAATPTFLQQGYGSDGNPVEKCRHDLSEDKTPDAKSIHVASLSVSGETADATVEVSGGDGDGSVASFHLVHEPAGWKLDRLTAFKIDRTRYDAAQQADLIATGLTPAESRCAIAAIDSRYDTPAIERMTVQGHDAMEALGSAMIPCLGRGLLIHQLKDGLSSGLAERGVPRDVVDCISGKALAGMSTEQLRGVAWRGKKGDRQLRAVASREPTAALQLRARIRSAAFACGASGNPGLS
jgi:hypothetical protein